MLAVYYTWNPVDIDAALLQRWLAELPADKREAIQRMRHRRARTASLLGLRLVKHGLEAAGLGSRRLADVRFPPARKPHLRPPVDFSITHSGTLVACALSTGPRVGLDAEALRPVSPRVFEKYFGIDTKATDARHLLGLWTRAEATIKAHGEGGIRHLSDVQLNGASATLCGRRWWLRELSIHADYVVHLATEHPSEAAPVRAVTLAEAA